MKAMTYLLVAALFLIMQPMAMAIEEPDYEVIESYEDFEIRRYAPHLVAEVDVKGDLSEAGSSAFRILANYIFGNNASASKMAMTAPVIGSGADDSTQTTYAFVMESKYTLDTLPVPNDERIRIRLVQDRVVAVRRYSGRWTEKNYRQHKAELQVALQDAGIAVNGAPVLARYNSPFSVPLMRRNEVMVEVSLR